MKYKPQFFTLLLCLALPVFMCGCGPVEEHTYSHDDADHQNVGEDADHVHEDGEGHHHAGKPGPNGGRLLVEVEPHLEFYFQADRHVRITCLNDDLESIPPVDLELLLTGGERTNPVTVGFSKQENYFLSDTALPDVQDMAIVMQISGGENEEPVFERFHLDMATCPDCQLHEYACICGHSDHDHEH